MQPFQLPIQGAHDSHCTNSRKSEKQTVHSTFCERSVSQSVSQGVSEVKKDSGAAKTLHRLPSFLLPSPTVISALPLSLPLSLSAGKRIPMSETLEPLNPGVEGGRAGCTGQNKGDFLSFGLKSDASRLLHRKGDF